MEDWKKRFHDIFDPIHEEDDLYCHYDKTDHKPNLESFIEEEIEKARKDAFAEAAPSR